MDIHEDKCSDNVENIKKQNCELTVENNLLQNVIQDQKQTIKDLQDKLENIAIKAVEKSTTTTIKNTHINYIQKMEPITQEHLITHAPQLTIEQASGYAEYSLEGPLKDRIVCVDYSRRKIKFKDIEGNVITDPEMTKLAPSIKDKSSQLVNTSNLDSSMFEGVAKLFNTNADVKNRFLSRFYKASMLREFDRMI
jgi:fructose-1,6-bisphosphatase